MKYLYLLVIILMGVALIQIFWPLLVLLFVCLGIYMAITYYRLRQVVKKGKEEFIYSEDKSYTYTQGSKKTSDDVIDVEYTERVDNRSDDWN